MSTVLGKLKAKVGFQLLNQLFLLLFQVSSFAKNVQNLECAQFVLKVMLLCVQHVMLNSQAAVRLL